MIKNDYKNLNFKCNGFTCELETGLDITSGVALRAPATRRLCQVGVSPGLTKEILLIISSHDYMYFRIHNKCDE